MPPRREGKQPISEDVADDSGPRHPRSRKVLASARRDDASLVDASPVVESPITESQVDTSPLQFHPLLYAQESFRDEGLGSSSDEESFREEEEDNEEGEGEESSGVYIVRKGRGSRFVSSRKSSHGTKRKKGRDQDSWLVTECMPGGSEDDACIPSFAGHVACDVWQGLDRGPLVCCTRHAACASLRTWRRSFMDGVEDNDGVILPRTTDDLRVDQIVSESELGDLPSLMYPHIDFPLLSAFVERWQPDTNTFHLPFGEMTIMMHDVAQILGLSIDGKVVARYSATNNDLGDVAELLGLPKETLSTNQLYKNGGISSQAIFDLCWRTDGRDPTTRARAYMFMTLGSTLFVDKSGSRVRPSLIRELYGQVHEYAWGAAMLAYLYHELGLASRKKCKKLAGCLTLLQAWIYEYFPAFRPHRGENTLCDGEPRCRKWIVRQESKRHDRLVMFRRRLDKMTSDEVM